MNTRRITGLALAASLAAAVGATAANAQPATPYEGLKKTVAVDEFQAAEAVGGTVTADGMTAMLTAALVKDGRFVVVERTGMASVQAEQALGQSKAANAETAATTGQLIGASIIVRGAVTKYEPAAGGGGVNIGGLPMGSLFGAQAGLKTQHALMEISLRLVDTTTGQVISTSSAEGTASSTGASATIVDTHNGAAFGGDAFQTTPIGQAGEDAIVKAVDQIAAGMKNVPWTALVVEAADGKVYVNAGADRNVQPGMDLLVYRKGKVFTDPATGEVLDVDLQKIGTIRIDTVRDRISTAAVTSGDAPTRGDLLKLN